MSIEEIMWLLVLIGEYRVCHFLRPIQYLGEFHSELQFFYPFQVDTEDLNSKKELINLVNSQLSNLEGQSSK